MGSAGLAAKDIAGVDITNQRETTIVWDKQTDKPIHNTMPGKTARSQPPASPLLNDASTAALQPTIY